MTKRMTLDEYKERATKKHKGIYEYRFKTWGGLKSKRRIKIFCVSCDDYFLKDAHNHLYAPKGGCQSCSRVRQGLSSRSSTKDFVKKADRLHNGIYGYSKVVYVKSNQKVTITCKKHGDFQQTPNTHLRPAGCKKCAIERQVERQRLGDDEFKEASRKIHGDKYDYSRVVYVNAHVKVEIKCPKHGWFWQTPKHHKNDGSGCNLCGYEAGAKKQSLTLKEFLKKAEMKHLGKYDYSKVQYLNNHTHVVITCPHHGDFKQTPSNHLHPSPRGCPTCGDINTSLKQLMSPEDYFRQVSLFHKNKYDYSKAKYTGIFERLKIICPLHGEFITSAQSHKNSGCPDCGVIASGEKSRSNTAQFIESAIAVHGDTYDYSLVDYSKSTEEVEIICRKHGVFRQTPSHHLTGSGCSNCYFKAEARILEHLKSLGEVEQQLKVMDKRFDFYLPEHDLIIERDGEQHYYPVSLFAGDDDNYMERQKANDAYKTKIAKSVGFKIARMPFWLTPDQEIKEIENILNGAPSYPDVPDIRQLETKPAPK
jgi:very-short-patch-repair endonuclease